MVQIPKIKAVDEGDEFISVRYRDPDEFDEIRTPDWAAKVARSVSKGSEVRTGHKKDGDDWQVQSVLIKKSVGKEKAREQAQKIIEKLES